jgi:hypothetical protein
MLARPQPRWLLIALAVLAIACCDFGVVNIIHQPRTASSFDTQLAHVAAKRRFTTNAGPVVLHRTTYDASGGLVTITWYDSDVEPTGARTEALVSLYVDGTRVASASKGSLTGIYDDGAGVLAWYGRLKRGRHQILVRLDDATGAWGLPYTDPKRPGVDELVIRGEGNAS